MHRAFTTFALLVALVGCGPGQRTTEPASCSGQLVSPLTYVFEGNRGIDDATLNGATIAPNVAAGRCVGNEVERDVLMLLAAYYDRGHLDVEIAAPEVRAAPDGTRVTLHIREGAVYRVGTVRVSELDSAGVVVAPLPGVHLGIGLDAGQVFQRDVAVGALQRIARSYRDEGFADVSTEPVTTLRRADAIVDVTVDIRRGSLVHIERIDLHGLPAGAQASIRARLPVHEGDRFSETLIEDARREIVRATKATRVDVSVERAGAPGRCRLVFEISG